MLEWVAMSTISYKPHGRSLINGAPAEPARRTFESRSRIDGSHLGTFASASDDQVRTALNLAAGAFFETAVLSPLTADDHARLLLEVARAFEARLPDIKAAGCHELAYPAARADGETARANASTPSTLCKAATQAETSIGLSCRYSRPVCFQNERDDLRAVPDPQWLAGR